MAYLNSVIIAARTALVDQKMKKNHSASLHEWPRGGKNKPGPPFQFDLQTSPIRITLDQEAKLISLSAEYGISQAAVLRKALELLYEQTYNVKGFNRNKFIDPCCREG